MKRKSLLAALLAIATTASLAACVNNTTPTTSSVTPTTSSQAPTSEPTSAPTSAPTTSVAPSTSEATSEVSSTVVVEGVAIEHNETIAIQDFSTGDWLLPEGTTKLDYTEDMLFADYFTLKATSEKKWTVEADEDTSVTDGRKFTQKLKSGGKSNASGRFIQVETDKAVVLSIWAISNGADTRQIQIVSSDETEIAKLDVVGNELRRYDVTLEEPGAFNINMLASINIYGLELSDPNSKVKDLVKDLSIVGPDELKVGDTFDPTQYKVFGLDEEGCHGVLLNADEYTLTTVDTSVEANETAPAILTATHKDDAELVSNYKVEVYQWYDVVAPAETANGKITVPTEVKKGEPLTIYGTPDSGYEWKSATVKVNGEAVNAEIVNNQIKLESVTGNVEIEDVEFTEIVETGVLEITTIEFSGFEAKEYADALEINYYITLRGDLSGKAWKVSTNGKNVLDATGTKVASTHRIQSQGKNIMEIDLTGYTGKVKFEFYVLTASNSDLERTITILDANETQVGLGFTCNKTSDQTKEQGTDYNTQLYTVELECGQIYTLNTSGGINFHGINVIPVEE